MKATKGNTVIKPNCKVRTISLACADECLSEDHQFFSGRKEYESYLIKAHAVNKHGVVEL
jgi:hypothetical protein